MATTPTFATLPTYLGLSRSPAEAAIHVAGIPFDIGTTNRSGARFGPAAIRQASRMLVDGDHPHWWVDPAALPVADIGDFAIALGDIAGSLALIERQAAEHEHLVALGGDHSISLPLLRNHVRQHGPVAVVHFDAHPDTWDSEYPGQKYSHGTPFIRAIEEGLIDTAAYVQLGIRGPTGGPQDYADALKLGARMITLDEFRGRALSEVIAEVRQRVGNRPAYVTLDIDCVDPAFAPGTGTPEVGGFSSWEILQLVRGLKGLDLVGFDLVEVSPPFDPAGITAILAANLVFEFLSLTALAR